MICSKCGKETKVICLCGKCDDCNGVTEEMKIDMKKDLDEFIEKHRKLLEGLR